MSTAQKPIYKVLSDCIIVDQTKYRNASPDVWTEINNSARETQLDIVYVGDMKPYTLKNKILENAINGNLTMRHVEYFLDRPVEDSERALVSQFLEAHEKVSKLLDKPVPSYVFAEIPAGHNIEHISFKKDRMSRYGYDIGYKTAQKVWETAQPFWHSIESGEEIAQSNIEIRANSGYRTVKFKKDCVEIGCQTIPRWEVEQIALKQGWV